MKKIIFAGLAALSSTFCNAADLSLYGLSSLTEIADDSAHFIRGQGGLSVVRSVGTSSMAFSIADTKTGSLFNLNATSQLTGQDGVEFSSADGGTQAVGNTAVGGIQFGTGTFVMDDFTFTLDGFSVVTQAQQVGGPGKSLDFSSLLPQN